MGDTDCLFLTHLCTGISLLPEICFLSPFLQGKWKYEGSEMMLCCHSWLQFLCWIALKKFKAVPFPKIFLQSWNRASLPACSLIALFSCCATSNWQTSSALPGEKQFLGGFFCCVEVWKSGRHKIVPVPLRFCSSPKLFPLLLDLL